MFEGQPKGLYALALANTGERFGYYTMLAIFTLFMQAKFGYDEGEAAGIYSGFLAGVYFLPLLGGFLADKFGYGKMVKLGMAIMFVGYLFLAIPTKADGIGFWSMIGALTLIAVGTGLFKGNLQVMVGNLYDDPRYSSKRDTAFSIFYMAINIGAMFAPTAATAVTNWMMGKDGFIYDGRVPAIAHQILDGTSTPANEKLLQGLIDNHTVATNFAGSLQDFSAQYIDSLSQAYNYGFGVACLSLIVSALIYFSFRTSFKNVESSVKTKPATSDKENTKETWIYDMRNNMRSFGKRSPLDDKDFTDFIEKYQADDMSKRQEDYDGQNNSNGRWRKFTIDEIMARPNTSLDISWMTEESDEEDKSLSEILVEMNEKSMVISAAIAELTDILEGIDDSEE